MVDVDVVGDPGSEPHDFMEYYSPPRVVPMCRELGCFAQFSLGITMGHDFTQHRDRMLAVQLLAKLKTSSIMLSPPCTMVSTMQRLWNVKR